MRIPDKLSNIKWLAIGALILLVIVLGVSIWQVGSLKHEVAQARLDNEQLQLTNDQLSLANEFAAINSQFAQYEDQAQMMANDTILAKYTAARNKVEQLMQELKDEKRKSAAQIKKLKDEISTLRGLLRHYVAQVDSLGRENAALRDENSRVRNENRRISSQLTDAERDNERLTQRMTLAEKLNVTGITLTALKSNGKTEKNVTKAKKLVVSFTIPQNNSTPVGNKTIYMRITSPEGTLLGGTGKFTFEGSSVPFTDSKTIEYTGDEIPNVQIYWDVNTALTPGEYTVELFADNFRLASRKFTLKK